MYIFSILWHYSCPSNQSFFRARSVDSKPDPAAAARAPRPAVQRSYRRSIQRLGGLRRETWVAWKTDMEGMEDGCW